MFFEKNSLIILVSVALLTSMTVGCKPKAKDVSSLQNNGGSGDSGGDGNDYKTIVSVSSSEFGYLLANPQNRFYAPGARSLPNHSVVNVSRDATSVHALNLNYVALGGIANIVSDCDENEIQIDVQTQTVASHISFSIIPLVETFEDCHVGALDDHENIMHKIVVHSSL